MKILYINHYAGSIYHGMEYRPYYLGRNWVKMGHEVTVVASSFSHLRRQNLTFSDNSRYLYSDIDGIKYIWCKTGRYKQNGIKRLFNIFQFIYKVYRIIPNLVESNPDLVIASSTYPFDTFLAYKIANKAGAKFVYEVHDLWPLTPMELGKMSKYHPFIWLMQRFENFGYKKTDYVVSLLPCAIDYMVAHGLAQHKFRYIPNGVDVEESLNNRDKIPLRYAKLIDNLRKRYKMLVGYTGSMGRANALEYLLEVAKYKKEVAFVLVGDGEDKAKLVETIKICLINNVFILPSISKSQIPSFLVKMDLLYIGWHKLPIYRFGICPNKLFDYMLSKRPILHSVNAGNDLVREANCGFSCNAEDVEAIIYAINKFQALAQDQIKQLGENGYHYVIKNHDYKILAQKFLECV